MLVLIGHKAIHFRKEIRFELTWVLTRGQGLLKGNGIVRKPDRSVNFSWQNQLVRSDFTTERTGFWIAAFRVLAPIRGSILKLPEETSFIHEGGLNLKFTIVFRSFWIECDSSLPTKNIT